MNDLCAVHARLDCLPRKVGIPLRKLLEAGQLNDEVVSTVVDAGEVAGDSSKLLAFTAGLLYLKSQGVPVQDVVQMAKHQGRKINLGWSANRWSLEHDRLSRAEALVRLTQESVTYDMSKYEALFPKQFSGYLVRTSQRLGMEGLRQRHCVASYHTKLKAGSCAIASVFVNHQRWTVQIVATDNPDAPYQIRQIKTRLNGLPSKEIREQIYAMLGVELEGFPVDPTAVVKKEYFYMENVRRILPVLRDHNIMKVTVEFDGSGDSGSIQCVHYNVDNFDGNNVDVEVISVTSRFSSEESRWVRLQENSRKNLNAAIEALTYDYLDEADIDWYNDDGGFGELVIDVNEGTVSLEVNVRVTEVHRELDQVRDIQTDAVL